MFTVTYAAAVLAIVLLTSGAILLYASRASHLHKALAWHCLSAAVWILGNVAADISFTEPALMLASGIAYAGGAANLFCLLTLVDVFVDGKLPNRGRLLLYAFPNLAVSLLAFSPLAVVDMAFPLNAPAQTAPGPLYVISLFMLIAGLFYGIVRLYHGLRRTPDRTCRLRLAYPLAGALVMLAGELVFDILLPLLGELRFYTVGPMSSVAFIAGCGYSIARHNLIDTRLIIRALERKVEERTREIQELQREQRQMMLELSHSLKTPLAVLKTKLERLERTMMHDRELTSLGQSAESLSLLVDDLLALANLDESLRHEKRDWFSLTALLEEAVEEVRVIAEPTGITVQENLVDGVRVFGNRKRLYEAVMNLAGNAVKYMGEGNRKELSLGLSEEGGGLKITVTDTGIGIPKDDLPRVFGRFYRGSSKTYDIPGTGLGLSIVERIVREHGGLVTAESVQGSGSTFTVSLPKRSRTNRS